MLCFIKCASSTSILLRLQVVRDQLMKCLQKFHRYQHWARAHIKTAIVSYKFLRGPIIKMWRLQHDTFWNLYISDSLIPYMVMIIEHYKRYWVLILCVEWFSHCISLVVLLLHVHIQTCMSSSRWRATEFNNWGPFMFKNDIHSNFLRLFPLNIFIIINYSINKTKGSQTILQQNSI